MHLIEEASGNMGVGSYHHKKQAGLLAVADLLRIPHKDLSDPDLNHADQLFSDRLCANLPKP